LVGAVFLLSSDAFALRKSTYFSLPNPSLYFLSAAVDKTRTQPLSQVCDSPPPDGTLQEMQWGRAAAGMEAVGALPGVPSDSANV
jgi:hypothetical protein